MNKKILLLICLFTGLAINAQSYTFSLVQNGGVSSYNFSITATPDYTNDVVPYPTVQQLGFTILLPDGFGTANLTGITGGTYNTTENNGDFPAPDNGKDARIMTATFPISDLGSHTAGVPITIATFDVTGTPTTGSLELLDNGSVLAGLVGGAWDSFFNVEPTGNPLASATDLYVAQSGMTSFAFNTLTTTSTELDKVSIYPNPVKNILNIKGLDNVLEKAVIYNVNGQKVITQTSNLETINTSELTTGIYFVQLESTNSTKTIKLIKE
jgi:hypothetical protein